MKPFKRHMSHSALLSLGRFRIAGLALVALLAPSAAATDGMQPGSLLLFPEFDSTPGRMTLISIVNTNPTESVDVMTVYYAAGTCLEFNRTHTLTALDTFNFISNFHNPVQPRGFLTARAMSANVPRDFNYLIGTSSVIDGVDQVLYAVEPFVFTYVGGDLNQDGVLDLDGVEYSMVPDTLVFPRFIAQNSFRQSDLVLVALTGNRFWSTTVDIYLYNDNEEVFTTEFSFSCWAKVDLSTISSLFTEDFLRNFTMQDPSEPIGMQVVETGWMHISGAIAFSPVAQVPNPAILGFLIERSFPHGHSAELPFGVGLNATGSLLDLGLFPLQNGRALQGQRSVPRGE